MQTVEQPVVVVAEPYSPERRRFVRLPGPPKVHLDMAEWLLAEEMNNAAGDNLAMPYAFERACQKLLDRLAKLITRCGSQALLARALHLARSDFQFLRETKPGLMTGTYLEGLGIRAEGTDPDQVHRALAALLGTVMELTDLFIGEFLLGRLLVEVWPDLPVPEPTQPAGTDT